MKRHQVGDIFVNKITSLAYKKRYYTLILYVNIFVLSSSRATGVVLVSRDMRQIECW